MNCDRITVCMRVGNSPLRGGNSLSVLLVHSSGRRLVVRFRGLLAVFLSVAAVASAAAVCPLSVSLSVSGARDAATGTDTPLATARGRALVCQLHSNI